MKRVFQILLVALMAVMMCTNVNAQTKRDVKKATKAAKYQAELDKIKQEEAIRQAQMDLELTKLQQEKAAQERAGVEITIPCVKESFDDENYFREMGTAVAHSNNLQSTRQAALTSAQEMIKQKMAQFVQGFSKSYFEDHAGSASTDDIERKMQVKMQGLFEGMLNASEKICETTRTENDGMDHTYITIQISKKDFLSKSKTAISSDERLKIDYDEEKFDRIAKEEMGKMMQAKKENNY